MIIERYKNKHQPQLDKVAYYVDDTNYDIMREILRTYLYHIGKGYQYIQYDTIYNIYKEYLPLYMYFRTDSVKCDSVSDDAYANVNNYTIIKIQKDVLITVE